MFDSGLPAFANGVAVSKRSSSDICSPFAGTSGEVPLIVFPSDDTVTEVAHFVSFLKQT